MASLRERVLDLLPAPVPAVIGKCQHCHLSLYEGSPVSRLDPLSHVACAVDARREH